jgi:hypothetical protein
VTATGPEGPKAQRGDAAPAVRAALEDLRAAPAVRDSGAWLEDKTYSVPVHTRRVPDPEAWEDPIDAAARDMAARHGLEVVPGKLVWELRIAVRSAEAPPELLEAADMVVDGPEGVLALLEEAVA